MGETSLVGQLRTNKALASIGCRASLIPPISAVGLKCVLPRLLVARAHPEPGRPKMVNYFSVAANVRSIRSTLRSSARSRHLNAVRKGAVCGPGKPNPDG